MSQKSLALFCFLLGSMQPQPGNAQAAGPQESRTPMGIWEYADPAGGAVGINLFKDRQPSWHQGPPLEGEQLNPLTLQIGVYHRKLAKLHCGEENFFDEGRDASARGIISTFSDGVLHVRAPGDKMHPQIEIELIYDAATKTWKGRFHRGAFDKVVELTRVPDRRWHDGNLCQPDLEEIKTSGIAPPHAHPHPK